MAVVSINIEALEQVVRALESAQATIPVYASQLKGILRGVGLPSDSLGRWTPTGAAIWSVHEMLAQCKSRLAAARTVATQQISLKQYSVGG